MTPPEVNLIEFGLISAVTASLDPSAPPTITFTFSPARREIQPLVVAQALAIRHPDLVKKLVLVSPFHSAEMWKASNDRFYLQCQQMYPDEWARLMEMRARGLPYTAPECRAITDQMPIWLANDYFDGSNDARIAQLFEIEPTVFDTMTGNDWGSDLSGTLAGFDFRPELKNLKMPTLILAGRADGTALPCCTRQYRSFAPHAEFVMLEKSGHQPFLEEPTLALAALRAFLAR